MDPPNKPKQLGWLWEFSHTLPLRPGSYAVIAENEIGTLRLNNGGETVFLKDSQGTVIHEITTGQAANGVSKIPSGSDGDWVDSDQPTPGTENSGGDPVSDLTLQLLAT